MLLSVRTVTVTEAKARLNELVDEAEATHAQVTITKHGRPAVVIIAADDHVSGRRLDADERHSSGVVRLGDDRWARHPRLADRPLPRHVFTMAGLA
jgi:prevent-host-death family protein